MTDYFFQIGVSNVLIAFLLAIAAMIVSKKANRPGLAYTLWLLVLLKLVTPPLLSIPIPNMMASETAPAVIAEVPVSELPLSAIDEAALSTSLDAFNWRLFKNVLAVVWLTGIVVSIIVSLRRIVKFNSLLHKCTKPTSETVASMAKKLAVDLQLTRQPQLRTTSANVSPLVWWCGGQVQVVLPEAMLKEMEPDQWRWALAHELVHVYRRDYLVRWLEWLACSVFWWSPLTWYARKNLRAAEEVCCDVMVLSRLRPEPLVYANSILNVVESLVRPAIRPPAIASEIDSDGFLERRFEMILSQNAPAVISRWSRGVAFVLLFVLPLGFAQAQDFEKVEKRLGKMVEKGTITGEQADAMMIALKETAGKHDGDHKAISEEKMEKLANEIEEAVAAGKVTAEQAREKHEALREIFAKSHGHKKGEQDDDRMMEMKEKYATAAEKIKEAVAAGKVSEEDAEKRMIEMRNRMFRSDDGENKDQMAGMQRRLRMAVESGRITREQAGERARAYKMKLMKNRYMEAAGEIEKAVAAGKISKEAAERRLNQMREKMFGDQARNEGGTNGRNVNEQDHNVQNILGGRLREAVASGMLTKEEARKMFNAVIAKQKDNDLDHSHDRDGVEPHEHDDDRAYDRER